MHGASESGRTVAPAGHVPCHAGPGRLSHGPDPWERSESPPVFRRPRLQPSHAASPPARPARPATAAELSLNREKTNGLPTPAAAAATAATAARPAAAKERTRRRKGPPCLPPTAAATTTAGSAESPPSSSRHARIHRRRQTASAAPSNPRKAKGGPEQDLEHKHDRGARAHKGILARSQRGRAQESRQDRKRHRAPQDEGTAEALVQLRRLWQETVCTLSLFLSTGSSFSPAFSRFFSLSPFDLSLSRNAIEEELEVLYDAYYEELEQYANYQQRYVSSGGTIPPPPGPGPFPGSVELDKNGVVVSPSASPASARGKNRNRNQRQTQQVVPNGRKSLHQHPHLHTHPQPKESEFDDDDPEEEEYEEEEEYDEEEDEEDEDEDEDEVEDVGDIQPKGKPTPVMPRAGARRPAAARGRNRGSAKVNGSAKRDQLFGGGLAVTGWCLCSIFPLSPQVHTFTHRCSCLRSW